MIEDYPEENRNAVAMELAHATYRRALYDTRDVALYLRDINVEDPEAETILQDILSRMENAEVILDGLWDRFWDLKREMFGERRDNSCLQDCGPLWGDEKEEKE